MKKSDLDFVNAAAKIKNRVTVDSYYFYELPQSLKRLSFTVSDLESLNQINIIKRSLENARKEGFSFKEWKDQLDVSAIRSISDSRKETVFRTNMASVYGQSTRYNAVTSGVTPYLMYSAVGDSRTRESHMKLDGTIKRGDSVFWDKYQTPIDYNCRCTMIPLTLEEAKKRGISTKSVDRFPEPGKNFGSSKFGDVNSGARKRVDEVLKSMPDNDPFKEKLLQSQANIDNLVDVWWQGNQDKFR